MDAPVRHACYLSSEQLVIADPRYKLNVSFMVYLKHFSELNH